VERVELTVRRMLTQIGRRAVYVPNQIGLAAVTGRQASGSDQLVGKPVACCTPRASGWSCYRALDRMNGCCSGSKPPSFRACYSSHRFRRQASQWPYSGKDFDKSFR
jgi:hypothetical protein